MSRRRGTPVGSSGTCAQPECGEGTIFVPWIAAGAVRSRAPFGVTKGADGCPEDLRQSGG